MWHRMKLHNIKGDNLHQTRDMRTHKDLALDEDPQGSGMPFKEYIVSDKYSSITHVDIARRVRYEFPNGFGASVVIGTLFYTDDEHPYELAPLHGNSIYYPALDPKNGDVYGYLDDGELMIILAKLMALPPLTTKEK